MEQPQDNYIVLKQALRPPGFEGVIVNLCVNLTGLNGAQIAGKTLFLSVSMKVFSDEVSV